MSKVELLATAIDNGINLMSELPAAQMGVPALTSIRIRHILNNMWFDKSEVTLIDEPLPLLIQEWAKGRVYF